MKKHLYFSFNHSDPKNCFFISFIKVQEGDHYAAGGWNGQVKRISHENGDSTLTNRTFEDGRTSVGRCGWGVSAYAMCSIMSSVIPLLLFILCDFILFYLMI